MLKDKRFVLTLFVISNLVVLAVSLLASSIPLLVPLEPQIILLSIPTAVNFVAGYYLRRQVIRGGPYGIALFVLSIVLGMLFVPLFYLAGNFGHLDCADSCGTDVASYALIDASSLLSGLLLIGGPILALIRTMPKHVATPTP